MSLLTIFYTIITFAFGKNVFPSTENGSQHRILSHTKPIGAPLDGKNETLRAAEDAQGYCIEYRETTE